MTLQNIKKKEIKRLMEEIRYYQKQIDGCQLRIKRLEDII